MLCIIQYMRFNIFKQSDIPEKYRSNFINLYLDIAWFGVLSGTAINFLNVYATRLGASSLQIGLLTATSSVVNLFLAIPAGHWVSKRNTNKAVFWSSVLFRLGYFLWIPLPWIFNEQGQISALIVLTLLMAIPLTPLGVGFNALFAEAVPVQYRARVAGTRNITFAIAYMLTSLITGIILDNTPFTEGYQLVFALGAIGSAISSFHLYHIKPLMEEQTGLKQAMRQAENYFSLHLIEDTSNPVHFSIIRLLMGVKHGVRQPLLILLPQKETLVFRMILWDIWQGGIRVEWQKLPMQVKRGPPIMM